MTLESQLYISEFLGQDELSRARIDKMILAASRKNASASVTGGLIFTGKYFAQILEGEAEVIDCLMDSIARDPRHVILRTFDRTPISARSFPSWGLAYAGPSTFVSKHITCLIGGPEGANSSRAEQQLMELMRAFAVHQASSPAL